MNTDKWESSSTEERRRPTSDEWNRMDEVEKRNLVREQNTKRKKHHEGEKETKAGEEHRATVRVPSVVRLGEETIDQERADWVTRPTESELSDTITTTEEQPTECQAVDESSSSRGISTMEESSSSSSSSTTQARLSPTKTGAVIRYVKFHDKTNPVLALTSQNTGEEPGKSRCQADQFARMTRMTESMTNEMRAELVDAKRETNLRKMTVEPNPVQTRRAADPSQIP